MGILKKIANVFGVLAALVLSLVLAVVLIASPALSAATSFVQTETIYKVVKEIDYTELIEPGGAVSDSAGIDAELVDSLMKTELVSELIDLYVDRLFAVLEGTAETVNITADELVEIGKAHADELVPIVKAYLGETVPLELDDDTILKLTVQMLEEKADELVSEIPTLEELGLEDWMLTAIRELRNGDILRDVLGMAAVLSILVVLCRWIRFKGFMWLGVVYLGSAVMNLIAAIGIGKKTSILFPGVIPVSGGVNEAISGVLSDELMKGAGILAVLAVLFIVIFAVGRKLMKKKSEGGTVEPVL